MLKLVKTFVTEWIVMLIMKLKVLMVKKLNYKLKVKFFLKVVEVSGNISNIKPVRDLMTE